jgi:hypothetical protein
MNDFNNKKLIKTYNKNGFTVKTYKPIMSEKERICKEAQIKYDIINIIKELTVVKK